MNIWLIFLNLMKHLHTFQNIKTELKNPFSSEDIALQSYSRYIYIFYNFLSFFNFRMSPWEPMFIGYDFFTSFIEGPKFKVFSISHYDMWAKKPHPKTKVQPGYSRVIQGVP